MSAPDDVTPHFRDYNQSCSPSRRRPLASLLREQWFLWFHAWFPLIALFFFSFSFFKTSVSNCLIVFLYIYLLMLSLVEREREISNLVEAKGLNEPSTGGYILLREFFALMMRRQHTLCRCVLLFHLFQPVAVGIPFKMSVGWEGRDSLLPLSLSRNNMSKARCQDSRTISSRQTIGHDAAILEYCRWQWYLQPPCRKLTVLGYVLIDIRNHSPYL